MSQLLFDGHVRVFRQPHADHFHEIADRPRFGKTHFDQITLDKDVLGKTDLNSGEQELETAGECYRN